MCQYLVEVDARLPSITDLIKGRTDRDGIEILLKFLENKIFNILL